MAFRPALPAKGFPSIIHCHHARRKMLPVKRKRLGSADDEEDEDIQEDMVKVKMGPRPFLGWHKNSYFQITPWRMVIAAGVAVTTFLIWYWALLRWGTVGAPFIWYYTAPFNGPNIGRPQRDWKPTSRFVIR